MSWRRCWLSSPTLRKPPSCWRSFKPSMSRSSPCSGRSVTCSKRLMRIHPPGRLGSSPHGRRGRRSRSFANFIELNRNQLLKEFRGGLGLKNPALTHTGVVANPDAPRDASLVVDFSPNNVRTEDGRFALPLFRDAVAFWDRHLREAEQAFKGLT